MDESKEMPWTIPGFDSPAGSAELVTLGTDYVPAHSIRALYIGGSGDVKVDMVGVGTGIVFTAVPIGVVLPIQVKKIYKVGTGATFIVAIW